MKSAGRDFPPLLVYRGMPTPSEKGRYNLILTPQLYLRRREALPVRYAFQARKLAPSVLEESGADAHWIYEAYRNGDSWELLAYDPREILDVLRSAGLRRTDLHRIYFAQQFCDQLTRPLCLGKEEALVTIEKNVSVVPKDLLPHETDCLDDPRRLVMPRNSFPVRFANSQSRLGGKASLRLGIALLLLAAAWTAEGLRDANVAEAYARSVQEATDPHPALASGIARKNIYDRYASIDRRQRQIRETIQKISDLVSKDSQLKLLAIDAQGYRGVIESPQKIAMLRKLAQDRGMHATIKGDQLILEGKWQ